MASWLSGRANRPKSSTRDIANAPEPGGESQELVGQFELTLRTHPPEARGLQPAHHGVDIVPGPSVVASRLQPGGGPRGTRIARVAQPLRQPGYVPAG